MDGSTFDDEVFDSGAFESKEPDTDEDDMADFATYALAETRARALVANGTWISAHAGRASTGASGSTPAKICVRVQRKMATTSAATQHYGGWTEITDNATA